MQLYVFTVPQDVFVRSPLSVLLQVKMGDGGGGGSDSEGRSASEDLECRTTLLALLGQRPNRDPKSGVVSTGMILSGGSVDTTPRFDSTARGRGHKVKGCVYGS